MEFGKSKQASPHSSVVDWYDHRQRVTWSGSQSATRIWIVAAWLTLNRRTGKEPVTEISRKWEKKTPDHNDLPGDVLILLPETGVKLIRAISDHWLASVGNAHDVPVQAISMVELIAKDCVTDKTPYDTSNAVKKSVQNRGELIVWKRDAVQAVAELMQVNVAGILFPVSL